MRTVYLAILVIVLGLAGLTLSTAAAQPADAGADESLCDVPCKQARANLAAAAAEQAARPDCMPGPSGDGCRSTPAPVAPPTLVDQLKELHAKYEALKSNNDKSAKMLLLAALIAAILKLALTGVNLLAGKKPTKWLAWIAMGLAVPIALLSYFAAGNSLFDSLVYAGAGPGAIVLHELLKVFAKPKAVEA